LGACAHEHEKYERAQVIKWWGVELENGDQIPLLPEAQYSLFPSPATTDQHEAKKANADKCRSQIGEAERSEGIPTEETNKQTGERTRDVTTTISQPYLTTMYVLV
jgi:hypothetical protein